MGNRFKQHWINKAKTGRSEQIVFGTVYGQEYSRTHDKATFAKIAVDLNFGKHETILDVGCGPLARPEYQYAPQHLIVGMDIARENVKKAQSTVQDADFVVADAEHLPFKQDYFSRVLCIGLISHLPSKKCVQDSLKDVQRILRVGGIAYLPWWMNSIGFTMIERRFAMKLMDLLRVGHAQYLGFNGKSEVFGLLQNARLKLRSMECSETLEFPWLFYWLPTKLRLALRKLVDKVNSCGLNRLPCSFNVTATCAKSKVPLF